MSTNDTLLSKKNNDNRNPLPISVPLPTVSKSCVEAVCYVCTVNDVKSKIEVRAVHSNVSTPWFSSLSPPVSRAVLLLLLLLFICKGPLNINPCNGSLHTRQLPAGAGSPSLRQPTPRQHSPACSLTCGWSCDGGCEETVHICKSGAPVYSITQQQPHSCWAVF